MHINVHDGSIGTQTNQPTTEERMACFGSGFFLSVNCIRFSFSKNKIPGTQGEIAEI